MNTIDNNPAGGTPGKSFALDRYDARLMGVCGGIANYAGVNPTLVRIGFAVGALASFGTALLVYVAIGLIAD